MLSERLQGRPERPRWRPTRFYRPWWARQRLAKSPPRQALWCKRKEPSNRPRVFITNFVFSIAPCCHPARPAGENAMATTDIATFQLTPAEHQIQLRRAIIASTIGTAIEWYDFFL